MVPVRSTPGGSSLGDFVRCLGRLEVRDEASVAMLAAQLGYALSTPVAVQPPAPEAERSAERPRHQDSREHSRSRDANLSTSLPRGPDAAQRTLEPTPLQEPPPEVAVAVTGWSEPEPMLPEPYPSLLDGHRARSVIRAAASARQATGALDVQRVVRAIASGRALRRLPLEQRWWARGVDVLFHVSPGMEPFRRDQVDFVEALIGLAGSEAVDVHYFYRSPAELWDRGPGRDAWQPNPVRPVVVLSDLSPDHTASGAIDEWGAWEALGRRLSAAPSALVFTPYGPAGGTVPGAACVEWSEATTVRMIRRAQREGA